jgi:hypothetical protein
MIKAMDEQSVLSIDDRVLPEKGVHHRTARLHITVMAFLAEME